MSVGCAWLLAGLQEIVSVMVSVCLSGRVFAVWLRHCAGVLWLALSWSCREEVLGDSVL